MLSDGIHLNYDVPNNRYTVIHNMDCEPINHGIHSDQSHPQTHFYLTFYSWVRQNWVWEHDYLATSVFRPFAVNPHHVTISSDYFNTWFIQHLVYPTPGLSNICLSDTLFFMENRKDWINKYPLYQGCMSFQWLKMYSTTYIA